MPCGSNTLTEAFNEAGNAFRAATTEENTRLAYSRLRSLVYFIEGASEVCVGIHCAIGFKYNGVGRRPSGYEHPEI